MPDLYYPTVDKDFLIEKAKKNPLVEGISSIGSSTNIILKGEKPIFKRTLPIKEIKPNQICFEQSTAIAFRLNFIGSLLEWLELNRLWKDGAYIEDNNK